MTFDGFPTPTKNFFSMPNAITDIIAGITNLAELKVIIYVIRHTWGFHEYGMPKAISVDEFMNGRRHSNGKTRMDNGTGLSNHSVIDGLKRAVEHEYLICEIDSSDLARVKKSYSLKMANTNSAPGEESSPPEPSAPGAKSTASSEESSPSYAESSPGSEESTYRSEKDTLERHSKKDTLERQGTYRASEQPSQQCANAQPAPVSDVPYLPDFKADSSSRPTEDTSHGIADSNGNHLHRDAHSNSVGAGEHTQSSTGHTGHDVRLPAAGTDAASSEERTADGTGDARTGSTGDGVASTVGGGSGYKTPAEKRAEQQNLTGARSQQGARQQGKQNEKPQLTLMGQQVRESYEIIRAIRLRLTPNNVKALNDLGDMDGMDFTSLKETIELIEAQNLVKSKDIPIDVQELASEKGYWRFDKWYPVVLRNRQKQAGQQAPKGDNNLADWVAESRQQQERMSQEESARRTEEARRQLAAVQQQIAAQKAAERQQQAVIYRVKGESYA